MVVFLEKPGNERREGHHAEQNPRGNPKGSGGADQDHGEGALVGPDEGGTGDLTWKTILPRPTATTSVTFLPWWGRWRT